MFRFNSAASTFTHIFKNNLNNFCGAMIKVTVAALHAEHYLEQAPYFKAGKVQQNKRLGFVSLHPPSPPNLSMNLMTSQTPLHLLPSALYSSDLQCFTSGDTVVIIFCISTMNPEESLDLGSSHTRSNDGLENLRLVNLNL